jgi:hypothetical protein
VGEFNSPLRHSGVIGYATRLQPVAPVHARSGIITNVTRGLRGLRLHRNPKAHPRGKNIRMMSLAVKVSR